MNLKTPKLQFLAVLLMLQPTMMMAQTDVVRRKTTTSVTTAKPRTTTPAKKQNPKKKQQTQPRASTTQTNPSSLQIRPSSTIPLSSEETLSSSSPTKKNISVTVNGVAFTMVAVHGGAFFMGATAEQGSDAKNDEYPAHRVTLSDYYIGETEVTQALWQAVMGTNPSNFKGSNLPVEQVSWDDCQIFISRLNQITGKQFRLPSETEWEYAARGGNLSRGYKFAGSNTVFSVAWYYNNSYSKSSSVGRLQPNELGIYDMSGNVWEWCLDRYYSYPLGPSSDSDRIIRGGSWGSYVEYCRVSRRSHLPPGVTRSLVGFRLAL